MATVQSGSAPGNTFTGSPFPRAGDTVYCHRSHLCTDSLAQWFSSCACVGLRWGQEVSCISLHLTPSPGCSHCRDHTLRIPASVRTMMFLSPFLKKLQNPSLSSNRMKTDFHFIWVRGSDELTLCNSKDSVEED